MTCDVLIAHQVSRDYYAGTFGRKPALRAVDRVNLTVRWGEILALVGESGCGKTTLGRILAGLDRPTDGFVTFDGGLLATPDNAVGRARRKDIQYIQQDPLAALNPRLTILTQVSEPARAHGLAQGHAADRLAEARLREVGLDRDLAERYPHQVSGGQRQRAVIARALVLDPDVLVMDEPVSALDLSIQAQVIELIKLLQAQRKLTVIFISHDLRVVRYLAARTAIMYLGRIVELGETQDVFRHPAHPYTRMLLASLPAIGGPRRQRASVKGEPPDPAHRPSGCAFHPRCPIARSACREHMPELEPIGRGEIACPHSAAMPGAGDCR
jgi:peptide/nickel transport system ATP-binding protein